jgi:anthranilate/para-aminobenzoate synthase component II
MAMKHRDHPTYGVQFHPESIGTEHGKRLLENFLRVVRASEAPV